VSWTWRKRPLRRVDHQSPHEAIFALFFHSCEAISDLFKAYIADVVFDFTFPLLEKTVVGSPHFGCTPRLNYAVVDLSFWVFWVASSFRKNGAGDLCCRRFNNFVVDCSGVSSADLVGAGGGSHLYRRQSLIGFERIDYFAVDGFAGRLAAFFVLAASDQCMASWSAWRHLLNGFQGGNISPFAANKSPLSC